MLTFYNPLHTQHAARFEIFRGAKVPAFEKPERANWIADRLLLRGHVLRTPDANALAAMHQVHAPRYLRFL